LLKIPGRGTNERTNTNPKAPDKKNKLKDQPTKKNNLQSLIKFTPINIIPLIYCKLQHINNSILKAKFKKLLKIHVKRPKERQNTNTRTNTKP
jgi:hypothetical protein